MRPSKSVSVLCVKWDTTVTTTKQSRKIVRRDFTARWSRKTPYDAPEALTKASSGQEALMIVYLVKAVTTVTIQQSQICLEKRPTTGVHWAISAREATTSSRSPASRELSWIMNPPRLRRISNKAIPHQITPLISLMTARFARSTTTAR